MSEQTAKIKRDYSMFDADLSGAVLNVSLLGRLFGWLRPYRAQLVLSSILVLVASFLNILLPITISLVAIDYIIRSEPTTNAPDFGLIELNDALSQSLSIHPLLAACLMYAVFHSLWAAIAHAHRMTLIGAVVKIKSELLEIDGNKLTYALEAFEGGNKIGFATHKRAVIPKT